MFYADLFSALERHQVRYLLVGGLAMNLLGVPRSTMDVDIIVSLDDANLHRFLEAARELQLKPRLPVRMEDLLDAEKRREWRTQRHMIAFAIGSQRASDPTVDVLIEFPVDFEAAYERRLLRPAFGQTVSVASAEDMISLKLAAGRAQDQADITHLERLRSDG